ncbi:preprotein translocase subunit SecG [Salininema proteolyticum]|uniref:Protein-export membrane protein SecG n=1 Tax=Salininema proteolyticum TaxID=1607685 RepID=A0ABV8U0T5_9ACTN
MLTVMAYALLVILLLTSGLIILLVLLHKGKGGGLSSMFGGGMSSVASGSSVAEKNLNRITVGAGIIWFAAIVGYGLVLGALAG